MAKAEQSWEANKAPMLEIQENQQEIIMKFINVMISHVISKLFDTGIVACIEANVTLITANAHLGAAFTTGSEMLQEVIQDSKSLPDTLRNLLISKLGQQIAETGVEEVGSRTMTDTELQDALTFNSITNEEIIKLMDVAEHAIEEAKHKS